MPKVNPEVLKWARETAGLASDEAARKLEMARGGDSGSARLSAYESGEREPTLALLEKMVRQYRRPLIALYLSEPPSKANRGEDYRTLDYQTSAQDEALLDALLRDVKARQSMVSWLMEQEDEAAAVLHIGSARLDDGVSKTATDITNGINFDLGKFRAENDPRAAFALLREAAANAGVFVLLIGNLGSHHTTLSVETFRGIAMADPLAPLIVINDQDASTAWSFTLLHELAHLWLGDSGISAGLPHTAVEKFCNQVASEILLPDQDLHSLCLDDDDGLASQIASFARTRNVSGSMVAYRLFLAQRITEDRWIELRNHFRELWNEQSARKRTKNKQSQGGPNYYTVRQHRIGSHLIDFVGRMLQAGAVTTAKAGQVLGVKPGNVHTLIEAGL